MNIPDDLKYLIRRSTGESRRLVMLMSPGTPLWQSIEFRTIIFFGQRPDALCRLRQITKRQQAHD
ncbi:hypothetical protein [Caballeronia mineralivorans]|uniref:hypothetical protein n=1 Tax=Caballeronia mineralivorans TaxID=2010198 RepID=UPI000A54DA09|nr:hypothetical protein [Caballeronia mineralivorans]